MRSNLPRKNFALIIAMVIIFAVLLAVYIPLKIHIRNSGEISPVEETVSFEILITRDLLWSLWPAEEGSSTGEDLPRRIGENVSRESVLIIDYLEINAGITEDEHAPDRIPVNRLEDIEYDAIFPVIASASPANLLSGRVKLLELPLPMVSANIVPEKATGDNLRQWVISEVRGSAGDGTSRKIRVGLFSVSFSDSIQSAYSRFNRYNLVNPRIAALEVINRMKKDGCHLIIAVFGPGMTGSPGELPGIDLILESGEDGSGVGGSDIYTAGLQWEGMVPERLRIFYYGDSVRVEKI
jgi:hypothetical protein